VFFAHFAALSAGFAHRALAARCADLFRWAGVSLAFKVAAPLRPPRRPMAAMTWAIVARSGSAVPSLASMVRFRAEAANWLMSWNSLRVRLGMSPVSQVGRRRQACGKRNDPTTIFPVRTI